MIAGVGTDIVEIARIDAARNDAGDASGGRDDALGIAFQHVKRGAWLVVEVVHVRFGHQTHQVVVARIVLGQKQHVIQTRLGFGADLRVLREVDLAAVDGLYLFARFLLDCCAGVAELGHAAHDAVIGNSDGGHVQLSRTTHHIFDFGGAVEHGIFGVIVQVNECHCVLSPCAYASEKRID